MTQDRAQPDAWPLEGVATVLRQRLGMDDEDAISTAETLRDLFQRKLVIEDTEIQSKERSFMWSLMLEGIVTVETQVRPRPEDGRKWRYFYWHLVPPERLLREQGDEEVSRDTVYDKLPPDVWVRGEPSASKAAA